VLAALLACLPARAVESIDLHATAQLPAFPSLQSFPSFPSAYPATYIPGDEWGDWSSGTMLSDLPLPADAPPIVANGAEPMPVPEPVSVLMLACGLLLMVPGAWAARWSRLGDSESLLQRRLP
jgi:hypothetical protein